jgi:hypothetical protein
VSASFPRDLLRGLRIKGSGVIMGFTESHGGLRLRLGLVKATVSCTLSRCGACLIDCLVQNA